LPSPSLVAARLDATRPELRAGSTRVVPVLSGVTFQKSPAPTIIVNPPAPPPVVIVTPPSDPPQTQTVEVGYPVPVYTGIVLNPPNHPDYSKRPPSPAAPPKPLPTGTGTGTAPGATPPRRDVARNSPGAEGVRHKSDPPPSSAITREKRFHSGEREIAGEVIKDVNSSNFAKALANLDAWSQRYRDSEYKDDRLYYYVVAHNGLQQSTKVLEAAAPLVARAGETSLDDPRQIILVLYLASVNAQKVTHPTREQFSTGQAAARTLLETVPGYFTPENRPPATSTADWTKARTDLEAAARTTLKGRDTERQLSLPGH